MKLKIKDRKEIIAGIMEILIPAKNEILIKRFGRTLLEKGETMDGDKKPIDPQKMYLVKELQDIDHEAELKQRIDKSKDVEQMQNELAKYVFQYGRRPERQQSVIINPLKTKLNGRD